MIQQKTVGVLVTAAGFAFIAAMTLVPHPELVEEVRKLPNMCLFCGELEGVDVMLNILLFVPLGIGLRLAGLSAWKAIGITVLTTFAVESLQYTVIAGRHASLSDVLTNSLGGGLGVLLAGSWRALILPGAAGSRRLGWLAMGSWLGLQTLCAWLLSIPLPQTTYHSEWAPTLPAYYQFQGTVSRATLGGDLLLGALPALDRKVRAELANGSVALQVAAIADGGTAYIAPIVCVFDEKERQILFIGEFGADLIFRVRMRASGLGLRNPAIRLAEVLPGIPGTRLEIRAGLDGGHLFVRLLRDGQEFRRELALSPSWGWSFFVPDEYSFGSEVHFLTALWIAGLLLPIAYWVRRGARTSIEQWGASALLVALVVLGIGVVPLATRIPAVHWSEWLAAATGLLAGWCLASVVVRFDNPRTCPVIANSCTAP